MLAWASEMNATDWLVISLTVVVLVAFNAWAYLWGEYQREKSREMLLAMKEIIEAPKTQKGGGLMDRLKDGSEVKPGDRVRFPTTVAAPGTYREKSVWREGVVYLLVGDGTGYVSWTWLEMYDEGRVRIVRAAESYVRFSDCLPGDVPVEDECKP